MNAQIKQTQNPDVYTYTINVSRPNHGSIAAAAWAKNIKTGEWAPAERTENASSVDATFWMDRDAIFLLSELNGKEKIRSYIVNGKRYIQESAAKIALEQAIKETKERKAQEIAELESQLQHEKVTLSPGAKRLTKYFVFATEEEVNPDELVTYKVYIRKIYTGSGKTIESEPLIFRNFGTGDSSAHADPINDLLKFLRKEVAKQPMQPQPSQQQQRQASKVLPAQGEIMRQAWAIAKQLAGGGKGSKKFLGQAMRAVYAMYK